MTQAYQKHFSQTSGCYVSRRCSPLPSLLFNSKKGLIRWEGVGVIELRCVCSLLCSVICFIGFLLKDKNHVSPYPRREMESSAIKPKLHFVSIDDLSRLTFEMSQ
jgi:hypothetical protein